MSTNPAVIQRTGVPSSRGFGLKAGLILLARLIGVFLAMLLAFIVSGAVIETGMPVQPVDASASANALLIVSLLTSLVLAYPILRSRWHGLKLMAAVLVIMFGVETFMTQIETLYFIGAIQMPMELVQRLIAAGFVRALVFAPLAVIILGKLRAPAKDDTPRPSMQAVELILRFAVLSLAYVVVYFVFGYLLVEQLAEARAYYAGTFEGGISLILFQVVRGLLWAGLALLIAALMRGKAWETSLATALAFAVLVSAGLLFPNPFMPPAVRQVHLIELMSSMLVYGAIAGWVWTRRGSLLPGRDEKGSTQGVEQ
jgi:hypothetical protein